MQVFASCLLNGQVRLGSRAPHVLWTSPNHRGWILAPCHIQYPEMHSGLSACPLCGHFMSVRISFFLWKTERNGMITVTHLFSWDFCCSVRERGCFLIRTPLVRSYPPKFDILARSSPQVCKTNQNKMVLQGTKCSEDISLGQYFRNICVCNTEQKTRATSLSSTDAHTCTCCWNKHFVKRYSTDYGRDTSSGIFYSVSLFKYWT